MKDINLLRNLFFQRLEKKASWGKEKVKDEFYEALIDWFNEPPHVEGRSE